MLREYGRFCQNSRLPFTLGIIIISRMKKTFFLFIGVLGVTSALGFAKAGWAAEQESPMVEVAADPVQVNQMQSAPQWKSSLSVIESTAGNLLETNNKVGTEYRALSDEATRLNGEIIKQREANRGLEQSIRQRQSEADSPVEAERLRADIVRTEQELARENIQLRSLKAKQQGAYNMTALHQLKVKELELEKEAALVDQKAKEDSALSALNADIEKLKGQVQYQKGQEEYLQSRIAELNKKNDPDSVRARSLFMENRSIRVELDKLSDEEKELSSRAKGVPPAGSSEKTLASLEKYRALESRQHTLKENIALLTTRKAELEARAKKVAAAKIDVDAKITETEQQNKEIEGRIDDIRENNAVLEYKIHTLERYNSRNKKM